jgi:fumarate hydratase class I
MPVTVAVDTQGRAVHEIGPAEWKQRIGMIPVKQI